MTYKFTSLLNNVKKKLRTWHDLYLINSSALFDAGWYLVINPDIANANINPAVHYLQLGAFEGRDPGPDFRSEWYLNTYPDVRKANMNPLVHYLKYGRREGRSTQQPTSSVVESLEKISVAKNVKNELLPFRPRDQKIFCVGYNKTGTTSIGYALKGLGYKLGDQSVAEQLMDDWAVRDFRQIIHYCETADAFQDLPFSVDFTYQILDYVFPGAKFILTVRKNADEWYASLMRFYKKLMKTMDTPTATDMKHFSYGGEGWFWRQEQNIFGIDESTVCNAEIYKAHYINHNDRVLEYFRFRPNDLLVLDLSNPNSMRDLCMFLGVEYRGEVMPHLNKSRN